SADLVMLLGADAAAQFAHWKAPDVVRTLAEVVVLTRGDEGGGVAAGLRRGKSRRVDISSTEIRGRGRTGMSVRGVVTGAVGDYTASHGLYRQQRTDS